MGTWVRNSALRGNLLLLQIDGDDSKFSCEVPSPYLPVPSPVQLAYV